MRKLAKLPEPAVLGTNAATWLLEYRADKGNAARKTRYRHAEIKAALRQEANNKCVYCESKLGHNTPGDVEHKIPSSHNDELHFSWTNLTLACTECNRRKNAYFSDTCPFLDPYEDDVEAWLLHYGPVVLWQAGNQRAEVSVRTLEMNTPRRLQLIARKVEKIEEVANLLERYQSTAQPALKALLRRQLLAMQDAQAEYSAMVKSILESRV